jgi:hypothetical protein
MYRTGSRLRLLYNLFILLGTSGFLSNYNNPYRLTGICVVSDMSEGKRQTLTEKVTEALEFHKRGDISGAISAYEGVIPELPAGQLASTLHSNVGALYMNIGSYAAAKEHFSKAVEVQPNSAQAHFNLAVILTTKFDDHSVAFSHCKDALKLDPSMYKAVHLMGNIMQNMGREQEAEKFFITAESMARGQAEGDIENVTSSEDSIASTLREMYPIFRAHIGDSTKIAIQDGDISATATLTCLSERPLIFRVSNLMTEEECVKIINTARPLVERSFVMGGGGGESGEEAAAASSECDDSSAVGKCPSKSPSTEAYRVSKNAWLPRDEVASTMQRRLAAVTGLPLLLFQQKSEDLQVVQYDKGGQFKVHQDSSAFHSRFLTALLYLNDVPSGFGGETWFPFSGRSREFSLETVDEAIAAALSYRDQVAQSTEATSKSISSESDAETSDGTGIDGGGKGIAISPVRGDAVVFFNHLVDGTLDPAAVHAGLPVLSANGDASVSPEKWIANYWVELDKRILLENNK